MANKFIAAATLRELEFILNGGVVGGKQLANSSGVVLGLHGLTLIINTATVTFSDPTGVGYKLNDATKSIKKEIEDATTGVTARAQSRYWGHRQQDWYSQRPVRIRKWGKSGWCGVRPT
jgi:hypothetical protein